MSQLVAVDTHVLSGSEDERPLLVGVAVDDAVSPGFGPHVVHIRGHDLRELTRAATTARRETPGIVVIADIYAVIAPLAQVAIRRWNSGSCADSEDALVYVGTPSGLAGLIKDLWALGVVDGALISTTSPHELDLIRGSVLPKLASAS